MIILSGQDDDVSLARAIQAGARGFLPKSEAVMDLADAIRRAYRGEPLHTSAEVEESLRKLRRRRAADGNLAQRIERLTPRELQILQLMADGDSPEKIAEELGMSRHTLGRTPRTCSRSSGCTRSSTRSSRRSATGRSTRTRSPRRATSSRTLENDPA